MLRGERTVQIEPGLQQRADVADSVNPAGGRPAADRAVLREDDPREMVGRSPLDEDEIIVAELGLQEIRRPGEDRDVMTARWGHARFESGAGGVITVFAQEYRDLGQLRRSKAGRAPAASR